MKALAPIKRGDTFEINGQLLADQLTNTPFDLTGYTVRSQLRNQDSLIQELTAAITDAPNGRYKISATPAQTVAWPIATLSTDIEFTSGTGKKMTTETLSLPVMRKETQ